MILLHCFSVRQRRPD